MAPLRNATMPTIVARSDRALPRRPSVLTLRRPRRFSSGRRMTRPGEARWAVAEAMSTVLA
jgi:hypothetical protein